MASAASSCAYDSVSRKYRLFRGVEHLYAFSRKQVYSLVIDKFYEADDVCKRLGGNLDFNFGAGGGSEGKSYGGGKYASRLKRIAGEKDPALLERIDRMRESSLHNPNISLMYVTGNLQGGSGARAARRVGVRVARPTRHARVPLVAVLCRSGQMALHLSLDGSMWRGQQECARELPGGVRLYCTILQMRLRYRGRPGQ